MIKRIVVSAVLFWSCTGLVAAQSISALSQQQKSAEIEKKNLQGKIAQAQEDIQSKEADKQDVSIQLKNSEQAISSINAKLDALRLQQNKAQSNLRHLENQLVQQTKALSERKVALAEQLRSEYTSGLSPWSALLSGQDAQKIGRDLASLSYVSKSRVQAVNKLNAAIAALEKTQVNIKAEKASVVALAKETQDTRQDLLQEQQKHKVVLSQIDQALTARRGEVSTMLKDTKRLDNVIDQLQTSISTQQEAIKKAALEQQLLAQKRQAQLKQQRIDAARKAAAQAELARQQAAQAQQSALLAKQAQDKVKKEQESIRFAVQQTNNPIDLKKLQSQQVKVQNQLVLAKQQSEDAEIDREKARIEQEKARQALVLAQKAQQDERAAAQERASGNDDGLTRGAPWPLRGTLQNTFGSPSPSGDVWRGIVIRAPAGTPVRAVAGGQVLFASWLAGFGNLMIIDHGNGYLSVYGYNQNLNKSVGQHVSVGDVIARVGSSGGQVESALYFEIRQGKTPLDPVPWLAR